jgi:hypothetical protein
VQKGLEEQPREFLAEDRVEALAGRPQVVADHAVESSAILKKPGNPTSLPDAAAARCVHGSKIGRGSFRDDPWRE